MTEAAQAAEAEQEVQTPPDEAAVSSQDRDFEAEAREMGWVPETDFKGEKGKWKPAQQFVEDGEKILPIVRSQLKRAQEEMAKKEADFAKRVERMENLSNKAIERLKSQHKAELERIQAAKETAVEAGDVAEYKRLDKAEKDLAKETLDTADESSPQAVQEGWIKRNAWFDTDFAMAREATEYSQWLAQKNPRITLADNLSQTEEYMKKTHPEKFGGKKPAANGHAAVDGGGDFPGAPRRQGKAYHDLPAEAKAACDRFVRDKVMTQAQYVKDYFNE
jgi:hypothetical protein